ncbi:MAG: molybdopterin-dependent oxidoreductase [Actinomycetota bacterium]|nr:molybdopterin-dependent oxidoreductase [Actinomycetota bacterium]
MPPLRLPETPPRFWPTFSSPLHSPAVVARVGRVLGIFIAVCFVTGLLSHYQYQPWHWLPWPAHPAWGYRLSQGLHVMTGIAALPLVLVKLWTVYPKLFEWPPARSVLHGLERLSIAVLVSTVLLELVTGLLNILTWYPWPWSFVFVHYALAYAVIGSVILHVAAKLPVIRQGLATEIAAPPIDTEPESTETPGLTRRGLLIASGAGVGVVAVTTVGQVVGPLEPVALLAPRKVSHGPLGVPINRTAAEARTTKSAVDRSWRLAVLGPRPYDLDLAALEALPAVQRDYPIACVEGWSVGASWRGPLLVDVLRRAGAHIDGNTRVVVRSLERLGAYRTSIIEGHQLPQAVLATHLNETRLTLDHGFPVRLIAPDRAGVLNTKWLESVRVI